MGTLRCYSHNDAGDTSGQFAGSLRVISRRGGGEHGMTVAICMRLMFERSHPCCQALTMKDAKTRTSGRLCAQRGSTEHLVRVHCFWCSSAGQPRLIRFFFRARARSKLPRCTLMPNRVSISLRHFEVVSSELAGLRSATKATASAEVLWP